MISFIRSRLGKLSNEVTALTSENSALREAKADMEARIAKLEEDNNRLSSLLVRQSKVHLLTHVLVTFSFVGSAK